MPIPPDESSNAMEVNDLILQELRAVNTKLDGLALDTQQRLTKLETQMVSDADTRLTHIETQIHPLFPNGQPGTLAVQNGRLKELETARDEHAGQYKFQKRMTAIILTVSLACMAGGISVWSTLYDSQKKIQSTLGDAATSQTGTDTQIASLQKDIGVLKAKVDKGMNQRNRLQGSVTKNGVDCPASTILSPQRQLDFPTNVISSFPPFLA